MNKKIPRKVYAQVAVGFFFSFLILFYFFGRLLIPVLLQVFSLEVAAYIVFFLCVGLCSLMVKPTIKKEMEKIDEPFSVVARNPAIEIPKEKLTVRILAIRGLLSLVATFVLSLPLTIIVFLRYIENPDKDFKYLYAIADSYFGFYLFFLGVSFFMMFVFVPSLKKWHWTKHQFG